MIDFEGSPRYGVVEYGVVTLLGGQITQTQTALCRPDTEMSAKEIALHGIHMRDTADRPPFAEHRELFFSLHKTGVFCAHHASVENGFLKRVWPYPPLYDAPAMQATATLGDLAPPPTAKANATPSDLVAPAAKAGDDSGQAAIGAAGKVGATGGSAIRRQTAGWGPWIDTRALFAAAYSGLASYALGELIETFALGKDLEELAAVYCPPKRRKAHCALFDALASALLLQHLGAEEGFEQLSLEWLLEHSAASADALNQHRQRKLFE